MDVHALQENLIDASKRSDAMLQPFDDKAKLLLAPLLQNPLQIVGNPRLAIPGQQRFQQPNRFKQPLPRPQ